jgi:hypothetical protein
LEGSEEYAGGLSGSFDVWEAPDKVTLSNAQFTVWITGDLEKNGPVTRIFIATHGTEEEPQLELVMEARGEFNSSTLVIKALDKLLLEIQENAAFIDSLEKNEE